MLPAYIKGKSTAAVLLGNLFLFTAVFSVSGLALNDYQPAFWYFLAFGEGLGLFDLTMINLLWRRSAKRIRFSLLPEKKSCQDPKKAYRSLLARDPVVCRDRRADSPDRHGVLNHT